MFIFLCAQRTLGRLHGEDLQWELLYRASRDGFSAQAFHTRVGERKGVFAQAWIVSVNSVPVFAWVFMRRFCLQVRLP